LKKYGNKAKLRQHYFDFKWNLKLSLSRFETEKRALSLAKIKVTLVQSGLKNSEKILKKILRSLCEENKQFLFSCFSVKLIAFE